MGTLLTCDRCGQVGTRPTDSTWYHLKLDRGPAGIAMDLCPDCGDEMRELALDWRGNGREQPKEPR